MFKEQQIHVSMKNKTVKINASRRLFNTGML